MGLFSHSKQKDKLIKYLKEKNISVEENNSKLECAIQFKDKAFSLYPYFEIDEENNYFSIVINIKKIEKESSDLYERINQFNQISQYFTLKFASNILYLEYNTVFNDNIKDIFDLVLDSLEELKDAIDNI